jgi:hypothetical protein
MSTPAHDPGNVVTAAPYQPAPAARWWKLDGVERDQALARLRAWVEQVYRPGYPALAEQMYLEPPAASTPTQLAVSHRRSAPRHRFSLHTQPG